MELAKGIEPPTSGLPKHSEQDDDSNPKSSPNKETDD